MLAFAIYFVAATITGYHLYTLLSFALYGAPFNLLELLALLGSFCLLIAAYVSLFRPHAGARVALIACLVMCSFYGPAIAKIVGTRFAKPAAVSQCACPWIGSTADQLLLSS